jgi:iron complex transport system substrate-binding protein
MTSEYRKKFALILQGLNSLTGLCLLVILLSCSHRTGQVAELRKGSDSTNIYYATRFNMEKDTDYIRIRIYNPWQGAEDVVQEWFLIGRGTRIPAGIDSSEVIRIPVKKIICMSTTHLAMISALGEACTISAFSGTKYIYEKSIENMVNQGRIREIGYENNLNKELILELKPDLLMVYGVGSESASYIEKLKELGIKVFYNADYLETDPLGKAEWIKLIGALYCRDKIADSIFSETESKYEKLKNLISRNITYYPTVLLGLPYRDTWFISPGNSYISRLISDAGGYYLWKEARASAAFPVNLETVYLKALSADFWLNAGTAESKADISAIDNRLADLECFRKGNVFNNNKRMSKGGGDDYWESGSVNPQLILEDIATILHPELFPGRELYYFRNLK